MASLEKVTKKRKRTRNTTTEQYEIYINYLKNDYVFRSGIINPTVEDNYLQKKWQELTDELNSSVEGPHMTSEEWRKRFTDWKYALRAKSRKILEHQNRTGSGPQIDIKLTPLEEQALSLWGKIVITGTPLITNYDGVSSKTPDVGSILEDTSIDIQENHRVDSEILNTTPNIIYEIELPSFPQCESILTEGTTVEETPKKSLPIPKIPASRARYRAKPISILAEKLLNITENSNTSFKTLNETLNTFSTNYMKYKNEKLNLKRKKYDFELAKYKFENPSFSYTE